MEFTACSRCGPGCPTDDRKSGTMAKTIEETMKQLDLQDKLFAATSDTVTQSCCVPELSVPWFACSACVIYYSWLWCMRSWIPLRSVDCWIGAERLLVSWRSRPLEACLRRLACLFLWLTWRFVANDHRWSSVVMMICRLTVLHRVRHNGLLSFYLLVRQAAVQWRNVSESIKCG